MIVRPAKLVREILIKSGLCQSLANAAWRCVTVQLPDGIGTLDDMVAVIEQDDITAGRYVSDPSYRLDPHVRIIVRGLGYSRSYEKIYEIADYLDNLQDYNITYNGLKFCVYNAKRTTNIQFNGIDSTGRRYVNSIEYDLVLH